MPAPLRYDHYVLLGLSRDATEGQIKRAYRERVKHCHPDRDPSPKATALFLAVHEAYSELMDPDRRSLYDERLRFYKPVGRTTEPFRHSQRSRQYRRDTHEPDTPVNRFAFLGLHVTGLCFGVALVVGILLGITFLEWPAIALLFVAPGLAIIPDSWSGLRSE
ncbi:MAG: J domain-containing protein [Flavobacteriales bacterium]